MANCGPYNSWGGGPCNLWGFGPHDTCGVGPCNVWRGRPYSMHDGGSYADDGENQASGHF